MDVEAMSPRGFTPRRSVIDALADELVETFDSEMTPGDAGRKNDCACTEEIAIIEINVVRRGINARNGARNQNLRSKAPCLLKGPTCKLITGDAARKA